MQLSKKLLTELQNRVLVANRKSPLLNALPGNSKIKLGLNSLNFLQDNLSNTLIDKLLTQKIFTTTLSTTITTDNPELKEKREKCLDKLNNILTEKEVIESEKGVNTMGIGFPLVVKRSLEDDKFIVAPLFIWTVDIKRGKKANTYNIFRNEDDIIYFNEVFKNFIYNEKDYSINIDLDNYLDNEILTSENLAQATFDVIEQINEHVPADALESYKQQIELIKSTDEFEQQYALMDAKDDAVISLSGVISLFDVQKQSIVEDYKNLLAKDKVKLQQNNDECFTFQSISSVETDPSQQGILNAIGKKKNFVIQGPPGTGKSQTLTAILVNAIENKMKTVVVCEKKTALDVLEEGLKKGGLDEFSILIRDSSRDRSKVVDKMRSFVDAESTSIEEVDDSKIKSALEKVQASIDSINNGHKLLNEKIIGDKTWSDTVVSYLKSEVEDNLNLNGINFTYEANESECIETTLKQIEPKYLDFKQCNFDSFINPTKFEGDNPYLLHDQFINNVNDYKDSIDKILELKAEHFASEDIDFSTLNSPVYKAISFFSKEKKQHLNTLTTIKQKINELKNMVKNDGWLVTDKKDFEFIKSLSTFSESAQIYTKDKDIFIKEFEYQKIFNDLDDNTKEIVERLKSESFENWPDYFKASYYNKILTQKVSTKFLKDSEYYNTYIAEKKAFDKEQIHFIKSFWQNTRAKAINEFKQKHPQLSIKNLYNKRKSKNYKRLSLREIIAYDIGFFTSVFPIIFTTAETISNLFPGNEKYFDLVLFDEASQLRIEDIFPALLKGKRICVSGDRHQMPPSSYFTPTVEGVVGEYEDELEEIEEDTKPKVNIDTDEILLSTESLLEFTEEINFENTYLDFHYRSQHPLLIEFSNHAFYGSRLKPLPAKTEYTPIEFIDVKGLYHKTRTNEEEANKVIGILKEIKPNEEGKYPSIGVATFNAPQRNLIAEKFQTCLASNNNDFRHFKELEKNGLFIKNLENIQGEERDLIIISSTFGQNEEGNFKQAFGPLNQSKGYKLLNVIITRAKNKVIICTSFPEDKIACYKSELEQSQTNNRRAVLYAYLAYAKAVSEGNQEEIQSILNALDKNAHKFERSEKTSSNTFIDYVHKNYKKQGLTDLQKHQKLGGFDVDIQYINDEEKPTIVNCDGTQHKNSELAYLYDLHSQKMLSNLGYKFKYEWSFNWWRK